MSFWKPEYANIGGFGDPTSRYPLGEHMRNEALDKNTLNRLVDAMLVKMEGEDMTGFKSKQVAAQAKLTADDDIQDYKREWVGLTDDEVEQLAVDAGIVTWRKKSYDITDKKYYELPTGEGMEGDEISLKQFADLISIKLKEKNA